jgi:glycyl-tRNA synthetase
LIKITSRIIKELKFLQKKLPLFKFFKGFKMAKKVDSLSKLISLTKRKGFIFQSSEIYGGVNGAWDYGPLGVELKRNLKELWWNSMVRENDNIVGLDASILMHPKTWEASGHVEGFSDPMVDCKECKSRFREDHIDLNAACPKCGSKNSFTEAKEFNLMFKTHIGPSVDSANEIFLRPETAQGIFVNFHNVRESARQKLPFGIAQVGKAFRNEINTRNFTFRSREFEQMEMQYFIKPGTENEWMEYWKEARKKWHTETIGLKKENLRFHDHGEELVFYCTSAFDIEYKFNFSEDNVWGELEGIHSRTNYDLGKHQEYSGKSLTYTDLEDGNKKYLPYVLETSVGADRTILALLLDAFEEEKLENGETRTVLHLDKKVAPRKISIFPLMKKQGMPELAREIEKDLKKHWNTAYDDAGAIGKRYRREDENGTPFCITVDHDSLENGTVTVRERDTMSQERISKDKLKSYFFDKLSE